MQYYSPMIRQKDEKIFYPVFIYYNITSSCIYCIDGFRSNDGVRNAYRLDRILHADIITSPKCLQCSYTPLTEDEQQKLYCFWGAPDFYPKASNEHNKQFHVKLKIFNETANLLKKIQSETANRKYGRLYHWKRQFPFLAAKLWFFCSCPRAAVARKRNLRNGTEKIRSF